MTLDKLAKIVTDGFAEQSKFNKFITNEVKNLRSDVTSLNNRFDNFVKVNNLKE